MREAFCRAKRCGDSVSDTRFRSAAATSAIALPIVSECALPNYKDLETVHCRLHLVPVSVGHSPSVDASESQPEGCQIVAGSQLAKTPERTRSCPHPEGCDKLSGNPPGCLILSLSTVVCATCDPATSDSLSGWTKALPRSFCKVLGGFLFRSWLFFVTFCLSYTGPRLDYPQIQGPRLNFSAHMLTGRDIIYTPSLSGRFLCSRFRRLRQTAPHGNRVLL